MVCFIEVTEKESGEKVLIPIPLIKSIYKSDDGTTCLETHLDKDGSSGYYLAETYNEIRSKLSRTSVIL